jgi:nucleoid-associated protein YgaU
VVLKEIGLQKGTEKALVHPFVVVISLAVMLWSCGAQLPVKEVEEAEIALKEAQNAQAAVYAPEEYAQAQENFYSSKIEINKRSYKKALSLLEDAKKDAKLATTKSQAKKAIQSAQSQLYGSDLAQLKEYITDVCDIAEKSLEKAESAFEDEEFDRAKQEADMSLQLSKELPKLLEKKISEESKKSSASIEMEKISKQARAMVEEAQKEAASIIANAERRAASIESHALEKWFPSSYLVQKGDKLRIIAGRKEIYNDPYQWPLLYKANRDQIRDPHVLFVGQRLVVPRKVTIEEVRDARRQAGAPAPYDPPPEAFHPSDYQ